MFSRRALCRLANVDCVAYTWPTYSVTAMQAISVQTANRSDGATSSTRSLDRFRVEGRLRFRLFVFRAVPLSDVPRSPHPGKPVLGATWRECEERRFALVAAVRLGLRAERRPEFCNARLADGDARLADLDVRLADGDVRLADLDVRVADLAGMRGIQ